jgi:hypothetical protein
MSTITSFASVGMVWWKSLEFPKEMPWLSQVLPFCGIEWECFPYLASLIQTPEFMSFPPSSLMSPSSKLQVPEEISTHVFPKSRTLMEKCFPSGNQDTSHNLRDVEMSNLSTCPCTLCYLSLDLSIFQGILESHIWHPFEKAQNGNTYSGQKTKQSYW